MSNPKPRLIALCGLATSGKSTIAEYLLENRFDFCSARFAEPLKTMLVALGLSDEQLYGGLKATPSELLCGKTPRFAMQTLGTEWGRDLIGDSIWTNAWSAQVREAFADDFSVITEDLRFANEAAAVRALGGQIWRVTRSSLTQALSHVSETEQAKIAVDAEIFNNGSIKDLQDLVDAALETGK